MAVEVKPIIFQSGVVDTENPNIVNAINRMIDRGYSKDKIVQIVGAPPEVVESHQRRREREKRPLRRDEREED
jgi:hypothetical protein